MPTVTYDGRGFQLDGRRIYIVSGSVHSMRLHPDEWADRLHACKLAGLNTVEVPVFWSRVEPRPGQFEFEDEADIRRFVQLAGEAGLYVILRVGPFSASTSGRAGTTLRPRGSWASVGGTFASRGSRSRRSTRTTFGSAARARSTAGAGSKACIRRCGSSARCGPISRR